MATEQTQIWIERLRALATPERGAPWVRRAGTVLLALAVVLIAATAAEVTWRVVAPPPDSTESTATAQGPAPRPGDEDTDDAPEGLRSVADHHLFGRPPDDRDARPEIPTDAPETRLNLALKGVLAIGGEGQGAAIIEEEGEHRVYFAGAKLASNAVVERVERDRVILSRDGDFEMLSLEREVLEVEEAALEVDDDDFPGVAVHGQPGEADTGLGVEDTDALSEAEGVDDDAAESDTGAKDDSPADPADTAGQIAREELESLEQQFREDPGQITRMVQVRPVMGDGAIRGFRLSAMDDRGAELMDQLGLRNEDVITEVEGVSVADQQGLQSLVEEMREASRVRVRLERNGSEQEMTLRIE
ncbi:type II secretion system protein N [Halorhodospira halophila]|uniref:General secretion pathway protein C n=1 Tax=Halorhodospira halophila (strain DSM 244 / SL1) TaxID=349124 RepID=A1WZM7_HALHL|nr:type II secretion system protein N [Halorhodospira halophila]ABM63139.1 general secretion pathway protein C [Halorhodospira halophila SL1]MBK1729318.1 hypothetical protein [Halorhodospira halophila]